MVKVFPAQSVGGAAYLRGLRGPFPKIPLVPTGGVTLDTVRDLFDAGAAAVGVGGEVFSKDFRMEHIEEAARRTRHAMDSARAHNMHVS